MDVVSQRPLTDNPSLLELFSKVVPPAHQNRNAIARLQKITDEHQATLCSASESATEGENEFDLPSGEEVFTGESGEEDEELDGEDDDEDGEGEYAEEEEEDDETGQDSEETEAEESGVSGGSDSGQLEFDDTETELPPSFRDMQQRSADSRRMSSQGALQRRRRPPPPSLSQAKMPFRMNQQQRRGPMPGSRLMPLNSTPQGTAIFQNALDEYLETARTNLNGGFDAVGSSGVGNDGTMVGMTRASRESSDRAEYLLRLEQLKQTSGMQMHFTADMTSGQLYNLLRRYTELATQNADLDRVLESLAVFAEAIQAINDDYNFLPMERYNLHVRAACSKPTFRYAVTQLLRRYRGTSVFDPTREVMLTLLMPVLYAIIQKLAMWFTRSSSSMQRIAKRVTTAFQAFAGLAIGTNPEPYIPADTQGIYVGTNKPPRQRDLTGTPATMSALPESSDDDDDDNDFVDAESHAPMQVQAPLPVQVPMPMPIQVSVPMPVQVPMQQTPMQALTGQQLLQQQLKQQAPLPPAMTQSSTNAEMLEYARQTQPQQRTQPLSAPVRHMPIQIALPQQALPQQAGAVDFDGGENDGVSLVPPS
jgi:hypothetical protein